MAVLVVSGDIALVLGQVWVSWHLLVGLQANKIWSRPIKIMTSNEQTAAITMLIPVLFGYALHTKYLDFGVVSAGDGTRHVCELNFVHLKRVNDKSWDCIQPFVASLALKVLRLLM